jgi:ferredoxin-NADP reductase
VAILRFETKVAEIIQRTYNVKSFRFARRPSLDYRPGQYLIVTLNIDGNEMRKPFSISSSPTEKDFIEFTKKLTGHLFSNKLDALKVGDAVTIDAPYGNFTFSDEFESIGLLSGGVGITPLRSICRYCTDLKLSTKVTLLYGNNTEEDIAFREDLEQMQKQNTNLKVVFTVAKPEQDWKGYTGYVTAEIVKKEIPDYSETIFYICGPPEMVHAMDSLLAALNVPLKSIKKENFAGY